MGGAEAEGRLWQEDARLASVLELVFWWLAGAELARAGAACRAWRAAARDARAWRRLLAERARAAAPGDTAEALRALAQLYGGACPWRSLYVSAAAPWREVARVAPARPARLAAAALSAAGDRLALATAAGDVSVWRERDGAWRQDGAGELAALGWSGVTRAAWAPPGPGPPRLLLAGRVPLAASRGALAVLAPGGGEGGAWRVAARAGGAGGCWAGGAAFLSLELARLSAPDHPPHFATDVWLNAADQATHCEFAGVAERVLRVYNEEPALVTQVVCAETPLDARAAQEWAEAEAETAADAELDGEEMRPRGEARGAGGERPPGEPYYRATQLVDDGDAACLVRLVVLACGARLVALALPDASPPPLRVRAALTERVAARAERRRQEALLASLPPPPRAPPPSPAALRARCAPPLARLRLPAPVLGLAVHDSGRCVWASLARFGGAACASLPALRVLRVVTPPPTPAPAPAHHVQPAACGEYFASPCGGWSGEVRVWGAAPGEGARLPHAAPALAVMLPPAARPPAPPAPPRALVLTEDALHVWECLAPRPPPPRPPPEGVTAATHDSYQCEVWTHTPDRLTYACQPPSTGSTRLVP